MTRESIFLLTNDLLSGIVLTICIDGIQTIRSVKGAGSLKNLKPEMGAEKITINLGAVEIGKIDMLVENAYYTDRSDFIRSATREKLKDHDSDIERFTQAEHITETKSKIVVLVGVLELEKNDILKMRTAGGKQSLVVVGLLQFVGLTAEDAELILDVFDRIKVYGSFSANSELKTILEEDGVLRTRKRRSDSK